MADLFGLLQKQILDNTELAPTPETNVSNADAGVNNNLGDSGTEPITPQQGNVDPTKQTNDIGQPTEKEIRGQEEMLAMNLRSREDAPLDYAANMNVLKADPNVWSIEDTQRGYIEQIGKGLANGLGEFVIAGTGDMLQVLGGALPGISVVEGNILSRFMQKAGHEFADIYGTQYVPENLRDENIKYNYDTFVNPKFWSIQVSQYVPQLLEFLLLSHGTSTAVKGATKSILKTVGKDSLKVGVKSAEAVASGAGLGVKEAVGQTFNGISGFAAKQLTLEGALMPGADILAGTLGGGIGGNLMSGLQNAAQTVNKNKELLNPDGSPMYTEDELGQMASGVMIQNLRWLLLDSLSWGVTYGKALKAFNTPKILKEFSSTGRIFSKEQQLATSSKFFVNTIQKPINVLTRTAKFLGKGVGEGVEETYQEVFENWAQLKAESEVTGKPFEYNGISGYLDFYKKQENESTKAIAFALGFLGGTGATISGHINDVANKEYDVLRRAEKLKKNIKSNSDDGENFRTMTYNLVDNHFDGHSERNDVYIDQMLKSGSIDEPMAVKLRERNVVIGEALKEGTNMNYAGRFAYTQTKIDILNEEEYLKQAEERKAADIKYLDPLKELDFDPEVYEKKVKEIEEEFSLTERGAQYRIAMLNDSMATLLKGEVITDPGFITEVQKDGKSIRFQLQPEEYNEYYKMTDEQIFERAKTAESKYKQAYEASMSLKSKLGNVGKSILNKFKKIKDDLLHKAKNKIDETTNKDYKAIVHLTTENLDDTVKNGAEPYVIQAMESVIARDGTESDEDYLKRVSELTPEAKTPVLEAINSAIDHVNKKTKDDLKSKTRETATDEGFDATDENAKAKQEFSDAINEDKTFDIKDGETPQQAAERIIAEQLKDKAFKTVNEAKEALIKIANILKEKGNEQLWKVVNAMNNVEDSKQYYQELFKKAGVKVEEDLNNLYNYTKEQIEAIKKTFTKETPEEQKAAMLGIEKRNSAEKTLRRKRVKASIKAENPGMAEADLEKLINNRIYQEAVSASNRKYQGVYIARNNVLLGEPASEQDLNLYSIMMMANAKPRMGMSVTEKAIALNEHLKVMYPNQFIAVAPLNNMYATIGVNGVGYALGSTIFIDDNVWEQNEVYMHEYAHILYNTNPDSDLIKSYLQKALMNKGLVNEIKLRYHDLTIYKDVENDYSVTLKSIMKDLKITAKEAEKYLLDGGFVLLPQEEQRWLNEELFVSTLQGPLSLEYNKFFDKIKEPARQFRTKSFWQKLKQRAVKNNSQDLAIENIKDDIVNLRYQIINGFVKSIQGKHVDVRGMALSLETGATEFDENGEYLSSDVLPDDVDTVRAKIEDTLDKNVDEFIVNEKITAKNYDTVKADEINPENADQYSEEVIFEKNYDTIIKNIESYMSAYLKNAKMLEKVFFQANVINDKKRFRSKINEDEFRSAVSYLANSINNSSDFIMALEQNSDPTIKGLLKYLSTQFGYEQSIAMLSSTHYVINSSVVIQGEMNVIEDGDFSTELSIAGHEKRQASRTASKVRRLLGNETTQQKNVLDALRHTKITKDIAYQILLPYTNNSVEAHKALLLGYITLDGQKVSLVNAIAKMKEKGLFVTNASGNGINLTEGSESLINALITAIRPFTSFSTHINSKGDQTNSRRMKSALSNMVEQMGIDLSPNTEGKIITEKKILDKYQHVNRLIKRDMRSTADKSLIEHLEYGENLLLKNIYANAKKGFMPTVTVFTGTKYQVGQNSTTNLYDQSTAEQNTLEDVLRFFDAKNKKHNSYNATPAFFGNSTQKYLMSLPIFSIEQLNNKSLMQTLYAIDAHAYSLKTDDNGNRIQPPSFLEFKKSYEKGLNIFLSRIDETSNSMVLLNSLQNFYNEKGDLTVEGKKALTEFYLNDFANKTFAQELFAPGISSKDIPARLKGMVAPTMPIDSNLHLEPIIVADQYKPDQYGGKPILANNGGQYIDEETALMLQALGHGVFDLNHGFKLVGYHQEMNNPNFAGRTLYLKGYTTVLTDELVAKEPHFKPYLDAIRERKRIYIESMKKRFGNDWESPKRFKTGTPVHFPIITPISSVKTIFTDKQIRNLNGNPQTTGIDKEGNTFISKENIGSQNYHDFLNKMYYKNGEFIGFQGQNFGIQQQMDKVTKKSKVPTQTASYIIAQLFSTQKSDDFKNRILEIQALLQKQSAETLLKNVTSKITDDNGNLINGTDLMDYIFKGLNKEKMLPALFDFIQNGGSINNPYSQDAMLNQIKNNIKKYGIELRVPGTWAQTVSDAGYRLHGKANDTFDFNETMKGYEPVYKNGVIVGNEPAHIVLPNHMQFGDNAVRARKSFILTDESLKKTNSKVKPGESNQKSFEEVADVMLKSAIKHAQSLGEPFMKQFDLKSDEELKSFIAKKQIKDGEDTVGYYVPGEYVIATRVPVGHVGFTGIFEALDFRDDKSNQVIVASQFKDLVGSDDDGDSLIINTIAKEKDGKNLKYWNEAFRLMVKHWTSPEMDEFLKTSLNFTENTRKEIDQMKTVLNLDTQNEYIPTNDIRNREAVIKNGIGARAILGKSISKHRALSIISAYHGTLQYHKTDFKGNTTTKNVKVTLYTHDYDDNGVLSKRTVVKSLLTDFGTGNSNRVIKSSNLTQLNLDAMKETFVSDLGLDLNSIDIAMLMVNQGISQTTIGLLLNHPIAKEYFSRLRDINNPYILSRSRKQVMYDLISEFKLESIRNESQKYGDANKIKEFTINLLPDYKALNREYNSAQNNYAILELINYYQDVMSDVDILSKNMSAHNVQGFETNPIVLEKNIKDLKAFLTNNKKEQLIYFSKINNNDAHQTAISENSEIKKYLNANELWLKVLNTYALSTHEALREVSDFYLENILDSKLTSKYRLAELTKSIRKIVVSRVLGLNNLSKTEMNDLVSSESKNNIFKQLDSYENEVLLANKDYEPNYFFNNVIDCNYDPELNIGSIKINRNLNSPTAGDGGFVSINNTTNQNDFIQARKAFSELPLQLQKNLIVADLILNGFEGNTLLLTFPLEIQKAINQSSDNIRTISKIDEKVANQYKEALLQKEIANEYSGLRKIFIKEDTAKYNPFSIRAEIRGDIYNDLFNGKTLYLNVASQNFKNKTNYTKQGESNKIFKIIGLNPEQRNNLNLLSKKQNTVDSDIYNNAMAILQSKTNMIEVVKEPRAPHDIDILSIKDENNTKGPTLDDLLTTSQENVKKKADTVVAPERGMALSLDMRYVDNDIILEPEQYFHITKFKKPLSEVQRTTIYNKYYQDKIHVKKLIEDGLLDEIKNPSTSDETLETLYSKYSNMDVYAFSQIITPLTEIMSNRIANKQVAFIKQKANVNVSEDNKDITLFNAMMQANNAASTHPATQAVQRDVEENYKEFINQKKQYTRKMNKLTDALYVEKFGRVGTHNGLLNKIRMAIITLFKGTKTVYDTLYGGITETTVKFVDGKQQKQLRLLSEVEIDQKYAKGLISKAEVEFTEYFRETIKELSPYSHKGDPLNDNNWIPTVAMDRFESFSNKGLLGLLVGTKSTNNALGDVMMNYEGIPKSFKEIEDTYRAIGGSNYHLLKDYLVIKQKAKSLLKKGINENGTPIAYSHIQNATINGDGIMNRFANNQGFTPLDQMVSMDLNKALYEYVHATLFVNGNNKFKGFKTLQYKIDSLMIHNAVKGYDNENKLIRRVLKEGVLNSPKLNPNTPIDTIVNRLTRFNLIHVLGWQMLFAGHGLYALGNLAVGKYNTIKNIGGAAWLKGELRFWGLDETGRLGLRKSQGILDTLNYQDMNVYDEISFSEKQNLDKVFFDLILAPMTITEKWAQSVHLLGILSEEQWNKFDENGKYKPGVKPITNRDLIALEDNVKSVHGRGYSPVDQRLIQTYSWGKMMMQFSRFLPTVIYDRFSKEDVNKYGQKHIGSLTAVWRPIYKMATGNMTPKQFITYRNNLDPEIRKRLDSGLRGLAMASVGAFVGANIESNTLDQLNRDMNIYTDTGKLGYRIIPPLVRTTRDYMDDIF